MKSILFLLIVSSMAFADINTQITAAKFTLDSLIVVRDMAQADAARQQIQTYIDASATLQSIGATVAIDTADATYVIFGFSSAATGFKKYSEQLCIDEFVRYGAIKVDAFTVRDQPERLKASWAKILTVIQ